MFIKHGLHVGADFASENQFLPMEFQAAVIQKYFSKRPVHLFILAHHPIGIVALRASLTHRIIFGPNNMLFAHGRTCNGVPWARAEFPRLRAKPQS